MSVEQVCTGDKHENLPFFFLVFFFFFPIAMSLLITTESTVQLKDAL